MVKLVTTSHSKQLSVQLAVVKQHTHTRASSGKSSVRGSIVSAASARGLGVGFVSGSEKVEAPFVGWRPSNNARSRSEYTASIMADSVVIVWQNFSQQACQSSHDSCPSRGFRSSFPARGVHEFVRHKFDHVGECNMCSHK